MALTFVAVPHTEHGLRSETKRAVLEQAPMATFFVTARRDPFSYGDFWRAVWRFPADLIVCEQDVVPPDDAIRRLATCEHDWCTHALWTGERHTLDTFGLVKFSQRLRDNCHTLMDIICARPDPRYWVRRGWTAIPRNCNVATLNGPGRRACLRPDAPTEAYATELRKRPTTHGYMGLDVKTAWLLRQRGLEAHVHAPPALNLHNYAQAPAGSVKLWYELEYDQVDWPADTA